MSEKHTETKAAFCRRMCISAKQFERYLELGMPHDRQGNRILVQIEPAVAWCKANWREQGRRDAQPQSLDEAKQRRELAMAELAELDLSERRRETIKIADYESLVGDAFARVRARLQSLAPRIAGVVLGSQSIQEAQARVEPIVHEVMEELRAAEDVPAPPEEEDLAA